MIITIMLLIIGIIKMKMVKLQDKNTTKTVLMVMSVGLVLSATSGLGTSITDNERR